MGLCQRIKTDRVLYDERVFLTETEGAIPLGIVPAAGSVINRDASSVDVAVTECDLVRSTTGATVSSAQFGMKTGQTITCACFAP